MPQFNLGQTVWRMLCQAAPLDVFCFHDLRLPSRNDCAHFDFLVNHGLIAPAPAGASATRRNNFEVKAGDPIGLFIVTEKGREAARWGAFDAASVPKPPPS